MPSVHVDVAPKVIDWVIQSATDVSDTEVLCNAVAAEILVPSENFKNVM